MLGTSQYFGFKSCISDVDHATKLTVHGRPVLHHQGARPRARARGRPRHHSRTPWRARHRLGTGPWDHLPRLHPRGAGPLEHAFQERLDVQVVFLVVFLIELGRFSLSSFLCKLANARQRWSSIHGETPHISRSKAMAVPRVVRQRQSERGKCD